MPGDSEALLGAAQQALEDGDWSTARSRFETALEREETAEALLGLGSALWWLEEVAESLRHLERAYAEFRRRPDPMQAAIVAIELAGHYGGSLGNHAAASGWVSRLARLVEEFELAPLEGWVLFGRAMLAIDDDDTEAGEAFARQARELARHHDDTDLELCALSVIGGSLVLRGLVAEGTAMLDEAMAAALGGEGRPGTVVHTSCVTIICCSRAAELKRAAQWIRAAEEFNRRYGSSHLYAVCRTHHGSVLLAMGRWDEAEEVLQAALRTARTAEPLLHAEALTKLAELRLAQGRVEEAAGLLDGIEDHAVTTYALATVRLAQGAPAVAASLLRRRLREIGDECLGCAALLDLLTEVEIARGETAEATAIARRLAALGERRRCDVIAAHGERALGRALLASGAEHEAAVGRLERALEAFAGLEMPLEAARARLLLARANADLEREAAIADGRRALGAFEALGASRDADAAAAFLRSLGVRSARAGPKGIGLLTKRELEILGLLGEGLSNREMAERLFLTRKTVENHVASVLFKLGLTGRAQAAAYAVRHHGQRSEAPARLR